MGERKVVIRGESLTLFCNVSGKPAPVVFWTHVESNDKLSDSTWEIKFATERDVGRYRCNATNIYGHASDTIEMLLLRKCLIVKSRNYAQQLSYGRGLLLLTILWNIPIDGYDNYYGSRLNLMVIVLSEKDSSFDRSAGPSINAIILR